MRFTTHFANPRRAAAIAAVAFVSGSGGFTAGTCACAVPGAAPQSPQPPSLVSAAVDTSGDNLTLTYNETLNNTSEPSGTAYNVEIDASPQASPAVNVTGSTVVLALADTVFTGQTVTLDYTVPPSNRIKDLDGLDAAALVDQAVTNNSSQTGGTPPGTANLWIDTNGGSCVDDGGHTYTDATSCTWFAANATCDNGDTVLVKGGSYNVPGQPIHIRGSNGRTAPCNITTVSGETVQAAALVFGTWRDTTGQTNGGAACARGASSTSTTNWITLTGPIKTTRFWADCSNEVHVSQLNMDNTADHEDNNQPFSMQEVTGAELKNSTVHGALNPNAMMVFSGDDILIDNNDIYDDLNNTGGAIHEECTRFQPATNVTMTRNHWWSCNVMDVFLTGGPGQNLYTNWVVENNIFEPPTGSAGNSESGFFFRDGADAYAKPDGFILRYNTFLTGIVVGNVGLTEPTANGMTIYGNYFEEGVPCSMPNTTYGYNGVPTGSSNCGTGAFNASAATMHAGFTDYHPYDGNGGSTAEPSGNYHLLTGSPLKNAGNAAGGTYPTLDKDGNNRFDGAAPDVGAYEFQE